MEAGHRSWRQRTSGGKPPQRPLALGLHSRWRVGSTADRTLSDNIHVAIAHHCAVLLNRDTFEDCYTCTPIQVPCSHKYSSWALEGMVAAGKFQRSPDPVCQCFTMANVHINNVRRGARCALRCFRCCASCVSTKALFCSLAISTKLPLVIYFSGGDNSQRRSSPLEAAFSHTPVPLPTDGVTSFKGSRCRTRRCIVARVLWLRQDATHAGQMAHQAPRVFRAQPRFDRAEQVGSFMASRTMAAPAIRYPQSSTALRAEDVSNDKPVFCFSWHKRGRRRPAFVRHRANYFCCVIYLRHAPLSSCPALLCVNSLFLMN